MKRLRSILGILLIILSIVGLFLWEWKGRETILMEEVLVAKEEIQKGTRISSGMFTAKGISKENILTEALTPDEIDQLYGKVASQIIAGNDQIIMEYFIDNEFYLGQNESIFVIDPSWIVMRSSSLRRGDVVDIYGSNGGGYLGTFQIAFVKDASEREVREAGEEIEEINEHIENDILKRTDSTSVIDHIEIISTYSEYEKLAAYVTGVTPSALVIVQRGNQIDS